MRLVIVPMIQRPIWDEQKKSKRKKEVYRHEDNEIDTINLGIFNKDNRIGANRIEIRGEKKPNCESKKQQRRRRRRRPKSVYCACAEFGYIPMKYQRVLYAASRSVLACTGHGQARHESERWSCLENFCENISQKQSTNRRPDSVRRSHHHRIYVSLLWCYNTLDAQCAVRLSKHNVKIVADDDGSQQPFIRHYSIW